MVPSNEVNGTRQQSPFCPGQFTGSCAGSLTRCGAQLRSSARTVRETWRAGGFFARVGGETAADDWRVIQSIRYTAYGRSVKSRSGAVLKVGVVQCLGMTCMCGKLRREEKKVYSRNLKLQYSE